MFWPKVKDWCVVIRRHFILKLFPILKFSFFIFLSLIIYFIYYKIWHKIDGEMTYLLYVLLSFIFIIVNYAFIKFILDIIEYYNDLIIVSDDHIFIIKSSLILKDDLEIIDSYRVMKTDAYCHWFLANIFWYWNLVIEQQKDDVRVFHFIPSPYKVLKILRDQKKFVLDERKKKYIVTDENNNKELH